MKKKQQFTSPYTKKRIPHQEKKPLDIKVIIYYGTYSSLILLILVLSFLYYLSFNLPSLENIVKPQYDLPTKIYDRNDQLVTEFYTQRRVLIPFENVPTVLIQALLAVEDSRFYDHFGIDPIRMIKALLIDIIKGSYAQGASTLTQQTAKMFLLTSDKKIIRKLKELLLAIKIESTFSKNQILELYLNKTYFGHGAYGIEAASQGYFSKNTEELNLVEAALLAGLPQAPSRLAPTNNMEDATKKRNLVLQRMYDQGFITMEEKVAAMVTPIELKLNKNTDNNETSYYMEHIRKYLLDKYGLDQLYKGGLKVKTAMDLKMQIYAQNALIQGLENHDKRQGYRGNLNNLWDKVSQEFELALFSESNIWNLKKLAILPPELKSEAEDSFYEKLEEATEDNKFIIDPCYFKYC